MSSSTLIVCCFKISLPHTFTDSLSLFHTHTHHLSLSLTHSHASSLSLQAIISLAFQEETLTQAKLSSTTDHPVNPSVTLILGIVWSRLTYHFVRPSFSLDQVGQNWDHVQKRSSHFGLYPATGGRLGFFDLPLLSGDPTTLGEAKRNGENSLKTNSVSRKPR